MCCLRADQIEKTGERPTKVFMGRSPVSRLSAEASDIPDISDVAEKMLRLNHRLFDPAKAAGFIKLLGCGHVVESLEVTLTVKTFRVFQRLIHEFTATPVPLASGRQYIF